MKEYPILFKGDLVRAILDGRKTQTRRIPDCRNNKWQVGDRLWVRETFWKFGYYLQCETDFEVWENYTWVDLKHIKYCADTKECNEVADVKFQDDNIYHYIWLKIPSIHMPRESSRILLEITDIREEYLQDITEEDAKAEGIIPSDYQVGYIPAFLKTPYSYCFAILWDTCSPGGFKWADNPKIKAVTFKGVKQ